MSQVPNLPLAEGPFEFERVLALFAPPSLRFKINIDGFGHHG